MRTPEQETQAMLERAAEEAAPDFTRTASGPSHYAAERAAAHDVVAPPDFTVPYEDPDAPRQVVAHLITIEGPLEGLDTILIILPKPDLLGAIEVAEGLLDDDEHIVIAELSKQVAYLAGASVN